MIKNIIVIGFATVFLTQTAPLALASLVFNGDFNTGNLSGWYTYAADPANQSAAIDTTYTIDLTHSLALTSASATFATSAGLSLNPSIGANINYDFKFDYSATNTPSWGSAAASINYYDSSAAYLGFEWIPLYHETSAPNSPGQWLEYSGTFTTPGNTASVSLAFNAWNWTTLHLDNVSLTPVPESSTLILAGLGSLMLCVRSRNGKRSTAMSSIPHATQ